MNLKREGKNFMKKPSLVVRIFAGALAAILLVGTVAGVIVSVLYS